METTVNQRIELLKTKLDLGNNEFCAKAQISTTTLWNIQNGGTIAKKTLKAIIESFNVNSEWMIAGTGKMFNETKQKEASFSWKDEAFEQVKSKNVLLEKEVERLWALVMNFTQKGANANFHKATELLRVA